jgi:ABC-type glycerol-3-phosphate transport system substrate-binding protein
MPSRSLPLLVLVAVLALSGCGGDDGFDGSADVPDGYATYRGEGVTFVHPAAWKPTTRELKEGLTEVRFQEAGSGDAAPAVSLTVQADVGDRFDDVLDSERAVLETTGGAKVTQDEVDVPGARKAYRSTIESDAAQSEAVDVLMPDGRHVALAAGAPDGEDGALDVDAVIGSLRVDGA